MSLQTHRLISASSSKPASSATAGRGLCLFSRRALARQTCTACVASFAARWSGALAACHARQLVSRAAPPVGGNCSCTWAGALLPPGAKPSRSGQLSGGSAASRAQSLPSCRRRSTALSSAGVRAPGFDHGFAAWSLPLITGHHLCRHDSSLIYWTSAVQDRQVQRPAALQVCARPQQGGGVPHVAAGPLRGRRLPAAAQAAARPHARLHLLPAGAGLSLHQF